MTFKVFKRIVLMISVLVIALVGANLLLIKLQVDQTTDIEILQEQIIRLQKDDEMLMHNQNIIFQQLIE